MSLSLLLGIGLAVGSLTYVLYPLFRRGRAVPPPAAQLGKATAAPPREVSDDEIEAAVRSYRATHAGGATCPACGRRPESDALYCSSCGRRLSEPASG